MTLKVDRFLLLGPKLNGHDATGEDETVIYPCWSNLVDGTYAPFRRDRISEKRAYANQGKQPNQKNTRAGNKHCIKREGKQPAFRSSQAWNSQSE